MLNKIEQPIRKTGIDILGDVPWGTHFCQFYQTKEDLADILVPYFKAGLENNEFCMWITSEPLKAEDAKAALNKELRDLDKYIKKGQIEILDYSQWYTKTGKFDADKVLAGWVEKEKQAIERGFAGLRLTGNTFWLEKKDWRRFTDYEAAANSVISKYRMLAICSYPLDKCRASKVIDVVSNHQFAIIRDEGKWIRIESLEHKKAEEEIKNLARFPEENSNPVYRISKDGVLLYANPAGRRLILKKDQTEIGDKIPEKWIGMIRNVYDSGKKQQAEIEISGRIFLFDMVPVIEGGYVNSYAIDITERKKAEEALGEAKKFSDSLITSMRDGLSVLDANGVHIMVNDAFCRMTGFSREELIGRGLPHPYWPPEELEKIEESYSKTTESNFNDFEFTFMRKNGERFPVIVSPSAIMDRAGNVIAYATVKDITERKKAEEVLRASEKKYRTLLENLPEKIFLKDKDSVYISCNENYAGDLKIKAEEIAGKTDYDFYPKELAEKYRADDIKIMKSGKTEDVNEKYIQNGLELIIHAAKTPVRDKEGNVTGILGVFWDITAQRQAQNKVLAYQKQLRDLVSEMSLIEERQCKHIATELHDRIAQNLILFKINLGHLRETDLPANLIEPLDEIYKYLDRIINDVRSLTSDLASPALHKLGLEAAIREWLDEEVRQKYGIKTEFEDDAQLKPLDENVGAILYRAVRELLINIIKHAKAQQVKVSIHKEKNKIRINVLDDGIGFTYPIENFASNKAKGFGLFSIRERLNCLGGSLEIDSKPRHGTRVTLVAPIKSEKTH